MSVNKKLSNELVEQIRDYYNLGYSCQQTADKFNVGKTTVRSYVDIRTKRILTNEERKAYNVKSVVKRRQKIKEMSVEYKGGSCQKCGYNKSLSALEFHHLDPNEKDFSLSKGGHCSSWEKVKKELDKCILVCANCHREIHDELRNLAS